MPLFGNYKSAIKSKNVSKIGTYKPDIIKNPIDSLIIAIKVADVTTLNTVANILENNGSSAQFSKVIVEVVSNRFLIFKKRGFDVDYDRWAFTFSDCKTMSEMFDHLLKRITHSDTTKEKTEGHEISPMALIIKNLINHINMNDITYGRCEGMKHHHDQLKACYQVVFDVLGADDFKKYYYEAIEMCDVGSIKNITPLIAIDFLSIDKPLATAFKEIEINKHEISKKELFDSVKQNDKLDSDSLSKVVNLLDAFDLLNRFEIFELVADPYSHLGGLTMSAELQQNFRNAIISEYELSTLKQRNNVLHCLLCGRYPYKKIEPRLYFIYQLLGEKEFDKLLKQVNLKLHSPKYYLIREYYKHEADLYKKFQELESMHNELTPQPESNNNNNEELKSSNTPYPDVCNDENSKSDDVSSISSDKQDNEELKLIVNSQAKAIESLQAEVEKLNERLEKLEAKQMKIDADEKSLPTEPAKKVEENTATSHVPLISSQNHSSFFDADGYPKIPNVSINKSAAKPMVLEPSTV